MTGTSPSTGAVERLGTGLLRELTHPSVVRRWASRLQLLYALAMFAAWMALITTSERWLPATLLAYGPRAVVLLPLFFVLPVGAVYARRSLLFSAVASYLALHSIMGFRLGIPPISAVGRAPAGVSVRLVTLNAQGGELVALRVNELLNMRPDVLMLQECSPALADAVRARGGYQIVVHQGLCTASRWPIVRTDTMSRSTVEARAGERFGSMGQVVRHVIAHPARPFQVVNLHLATARHGLAALLKDEGLLPDDGSLPRTLPIDLSRSEGVENNARLRTLQSERAAEWAAAEGATYPLVVAGDFNVPVESTIYRRFWRAYGNAFEDRGTGLGYTKREGRLIRIRIDHVLTSKLVKVKRVWVGPFIGSDHLPVVADLRL